MALYSDPKLGSLGSYSAACAWALASTGQGDAAGLDDGERARLRKQALDWLRRQLVVHLRNRSLGDPPYYQMQGWQLEHALYGIREEASLAKLPAEERLEFELFWAEVAELQAASNVSRARREQVLADSRLAEEGSSLLHQKQWADAEPLLRKSLAVSVKTRPNPEETYNLRSMLGEALVGQQKYAEAEPHLRRAFYGMRDAQGPPSDAMRDAVARLEQLYDAMGNQEEAARWRKERERYSGPLLEVGAGLELKGTLNSQLQSLTYQVTFVAGGTYVLEMVSPDQKALVPSLLLTDAVGRTLAQDNNSGGINARIVFRAGETGACRIRATSKNGGDGAFTLTVREQPLERARYHAGRREWQQAVKAYALVIDQQLPDWGEVAFEYAAVLLLAGDQAGYQVICERLVQQSGRPGVRPYHVARACSLAPGSFTPAERPGELAKIELDRNGTAFWSLWLRGALHYRAERHQDALPLLQKSRDDKSNPPDGVAATRQWLALTYHKLNQPEEAQREFEQAEKWLAKFPDGLPTDVSKREGVHLHNWLEVHVLRREAEALLVPKKE